jgi:hypothetical protein
MTRRLTLFQLGDVITGEPQLYVANPPALAAESVAETSPVSQPAACNPLKRFAAVIRRHLRLGPTPEDALAAAFGKAFRP